ncbi:MAG: hypothetical protein ICCCNLDF_00449 [Planctomycetes bacterium]|nr:hypothetical protein [Planctomycetota bacterium]
MRQVMVGLLALVLLPAVVVSQDKPAAEKPQRLAMFFEETTLSEVLHKLRTELGYTVFRSPLVEGELLVSIDCIASPQLVCELLSEQLELQFILHHDRKMLEVRPRDETSLFAKQVLVELRQLDASLRKGESALGAYRGPEGELLSEIKVKTGELFCQTLNFAAGIDVYGREARLGDVELLLRLHSGEERCLHELARLLDGAVGGQSEWLIRQAEAWSKLKNTKLSLDAVDQDFEDVLGEIAKQLGVHTYVSQEAKSQTDDWPIDFSVSDIAALDALDILMDWCELKFCLVEDLLVVRAVEEEPYDSPATGYATYELGALVASRAAKSKEKSDTLHRDVLSEIIDGMSLVLDPETGRSSITRFGTRVVVKGDARRQEAVTEFLLALGWKAE